MQKQPSISLKTVLLVNDAESLRLTIRWFLAHFNFDVIIARNSEEALSIFDPRKHDAVITNDPVLGMTGVELARALKERSPSTPIVMYADSPPKRDASLDVTIQRPTHLIYLKDALERLMDAGQQK